MEGDLWYRCLISPGMVCRGLEQAPWHIKCWQSGPALQRNAGLERFPAGDVPRLQPEDRHEGAQAEAEDHN